MRFATAMFTLVAAQLVAAEVIQTTATTSPPPQSTASSDVIPKIDLNPLWGGMTFSQPIDLTAAPGNETTFFIAERPGRIFAIDTESSAPVKRTFLDIRKDKVSMQNSEEGLLAMAFDPDYQSSGKVYVYYTASKPRRGVLARFTAKSGSKEPIDPATEEVLLTVEQPWGNHNGGTVLFGPDGYLYISLGDGGAADDPHGHGQDLSTLLGTILRIDVNNSQVDGKAYAIPPGNPFVGQSGAHNEIWAYGLRNVWRMSFDQKTGALWAGDVGQNKFEEVDIIVKGGNYGWNAREGKHAFRGGEGQGPFVEPVFEYNRRGGGSITGGYVYRGKAYPQLDGIYFVADFMSGRIWGLRAKGWSGDLRPRGLSLKSSKIDHIIWHRTRWGTLCLWV